MMLKGIRIQALSLTRNKDTGVLELQGSYQLMSSNDTVVASQNINGYSEIKYQPSGETQTALNNLVAAMSKELGAQLGFT